MKFKDDNLQRGAKNIALTAVMAATISAGKIALAVFPNVEIVTLLCAAYGYVFGFLGVAASLIFVLCETFIWGVGTWTIAYFIHWPLVCCVFMLAKKLRVKNRFILTITAIILTISFGILTALIDVGIFSAASNNFFERFIIYYMRGILFYLTHVLSSTVCFLFVFPRLSRTLQTYKIRSLFNRF